MRVLWSLPAAAPVLLRHMGAYADLAGQDLVRAQREWTARLSATVLASVAAFFAVMMGCLYVIAGTWDTPHRSSAIAWMGGIFVLCTLFAFLYRANLMRHQSPFLSSVRREWQEDRVILDRMLSADPD